MAADKMIGLREAAEQLGIDLTYLLRIIDVGDVLPSVVELHEGQLWSEKTEAKFSGSDLSSFAAEIVRRRFVALKVAREPVIRPDASFAFSLGWTSLLDAMAGELADLDGSARIAGGKEKFGSMIVFVDHDPAKRDAVSHLKESYRKRSVTICEECGAAGRLRMSYHRAQTLCDRHAHLAEPLRDDDGKIVDLPPTVGPIYDDGSQGKY